MDRDAEAVKRRLLGARKYKPYIMRRSEKILVEKLDENQERAYYEIMGAPSLYDNQGCMKTAKYGSSAFMPSGLTEEEIQEIKLRVRARYDEWCIYMVNNGMDIEYSICRYISQQGQTITEIKTRMRKRYGAVEKMFHDALDEYVKVAKW